MTTDGAGRLRPDLKTWRIVNVIHGMITHGLEAAGEEDLEGLVGAQLRHAGMYIAGALATLEVVAPGGTHDPEPATVVAVSLTDLHQLIASVTGTLERVRQNVGAHELLTQIGDLRSRLIAADIALREALGLSTD